MVQAVQGLIPQKIPNRTSLKAHPGAVPFSIDFSVMASPQNVDLSQSSSLKNAVGDVRTVYVDNSNNSASLSLTCAITRQVLTWPAFTQGYLQCAATQPQFQISTTGNVLVGFQFFNIEIDNFIWSPSGASTIGSVLFAGSNGIDHSVNPLAYPPAGYTKIQTVAANTSRAAIAVQNQSTDNIQVWRTGESGSGDTMISLLAAGAAGVAGGAFYSQTYKGVIEVWVPTGNAATDQVSVYED